MKGIRSEATIGVTTDNFIGTNTVPPASVLSRAADASDAVVWAPLTICRSVAEVTMTDPSTRRAVITSDAVAAIPLLKAKNFLGSFATVAAIPLFTLPLRPRKVLTLPSNRRLPRRM